jgi:hypothetical protein
MDMMHSVWDYDDDEEDDQGKPQRFAEWVERLHIRSKSSNTGSSVGLSVQKPRRKERSLSKALKGVFGKKKGATL